MNVTPEFMRDVQRAGWLIIAADEKAVLAGCTRAGCNLRIRLRAGGKVPEACNPDPAIGEIIIDNWSQVSDRLLERREQLCLSIKDVEYAAGLADDYLAKFGKHNPAKIPNAQAFFEWARSLGYQVVLRPTDLPPLTLRVLAESRDPKIMADRQNKFRHFGRVRATIRSRKK